MVTASWVCSRHLGHCGLKEKKKIQVKTVATFLAIKQTLEILGHSGNKKLNIGSRK